MSDDDLDVRGVQGLLDALRAPGSADELTGEEPALAAFRSGGRGTPRRKRMIGRAAVGGTGIVCGLLVTGGVAAAYTSGLPDPFQRAVRSVVTPLGIPAPPAPQVAATARKPAVLGPRLAGPRLPTSGPVAATAPVRPPAGLPTPGATAAPAAAAPPAAAAKPTAAPTAAPPPARITVAVSRSSVPVHSGLTLSGRLTRDDAALAGRRVYASELVAGQSSWRRVASGTTGSDGRVSLPIPALTKNVQLRLVTAQGVVSSTRRVVVVPLLTVEIARAGNRRTATVTTDGGTVGDRLVLLRLDGSTWRAVASTSLGSGGSASFTVPGPAQARVRYRVRLNATTTHAVSHVDFAIAAR